MKKPVVHKWKLYAICLIVYVFLLAGRTSSDQVVLDQQSRLDLSWDWLTRYELTSGSGWRRSSQTGEYLVCDLPETSTRSTNSWLISNYIDLKGAISVTFDVVFTARRCDKQSLPYCREYFNLYYYETSHNLVSGVQKETVLGGRFNLVDQIYAYDTWLPGNPRIKNTARVNFTVSQQGLYLGFQDIGGCLALAEIRLSFIYCPAQVLGGATFPKTASPPEGSARNVNGKCAVNSQSLHNESSILLQCFSNGSWSVRYQPLCLCKPGFQMAQKGCQECPPGSYKGNFSNSNCRGCPANSNSNSSLEQCSCNIGYYRAPSESKEEKCTTTPSAPVNLYVPFRDQSVVVVAWLPPHDSGGRKDVVYEVTCFQCNRNYFVESLLCGRGRPCDSSLEYWPMKNNTPFTHVTITGLQTHTSYKVRVRSKNGVSALAGLNSSKSAEVTFVTRISDRMLLNETYADDTTVVLSWRSLESPVNGTWHQRYEVSCLKCDHSGEDLYSQCNTECSKDVRYWPRRQALTDSYVTVSELQPSTWYKFVLHLWLSGIPLATVYVKTKETEDYKTVSSVTPDAVNKDWLETFFTLPTIMALAIAATLFIAAVIILLASVLLRKRWYKDALKSTKDDRKSIENTDNTIIMEEILQDFGRGAAGIAEGSH